MPNTDDLKRAAGYHAANLIEDGMVIGLGTGSTVRFLLEAIAERRAAGDLKNVVGIPTSETTRTKSLKLGIPLTDFSAHSHADLTLDGADEFDPALDLIKGLGGALLREKLVAMASSNFVVLVDDSKRVGRLGERVPLPVEIEPFGLGLQKPFLAELGCDPRLRCTADGDPFRTDGGNFVVDCYFNSGIPDKQELAAVLDRRSGIFEHGLFLEMCSTVIVAGDGGVTTVQRTY